ncbi:MAG: macro domain-containing protein, partial [Armatimonadetes bacterium]|nr:macro domain-containing protein [Armatimonadota bacterium]
KNTVNEVGVMGKGVALAFRDAFPDNTSAYVAACRRGDVRVGAMHVTERPAPPRWIINFPTKRHWRDPSRMDWIRDGLSDLVKVLHAHRIRSVAVPPLGCGNGGLEWTHVRDEIEVALGDLDGVDVTVYAPTDTYVSSPKSQGVEDLTPARALIAAIVRRYEAFGNGCTILEVQKLAWMLHQSITALNMPDPLRLDFRADRYGPYSDSLRHLLDSLDGSYLHCDRRLGGARPYDSIWFEAGRAAALDAYIGDAPSRWSEALDHTTSMIEGFESPLGLEALATVGWLLSSGLAHADWRSVKAALGQWPAGADAAERKLRVLDDDLIKLAVRRLCVESSAKIAERIAA